MGNKMKSLSKWLSWKENPGPPPLLLIILYAGILIMVLMSVLPALGNPYSTMPVNQLMAALEQHGYVAFASPQGELTVTGDILPSSDCGSSLGSDTLRFQKGWFCSSSILIGDVEISNAGSQLDIDGQLVLHGPGKVWMELQPDLDYATVQALGKPTQVYRGVSSGFSLPIFNDDNEELYVSMDVPREWDGITNPIVHIHCYIPESGEGSWVSPTGFTDYNGWEDETLAYDCDAETYSYNSINGTSWSSFLEFDVPLQLYSSVVFYAKFDEDNINATDIEAYYSSGWHTVYQGSYESMSWVDKSLGGDYSVSKYRIRFYNAGLNPKDARLYETSLCSVAGQGNLNFEIGWNSYTVSLHDSVSDTPNLETVQIETVEGSNKSYVANIELDTTDMTTCDQLDLRLRRIAASENEVDAEVVITHIGIQFLRDKLGEVTP